MDTTIKPISKTINIDLYSPTSYEVIKAQQGDNLSRIIEFVLYNQGKPYTIPENVTIKMEGHRGDNSYFKPKDCTVSQNIISCVLDEDILYEAGTVEAKIVMYMTNNTILSTIPFKIYVQKNPCDKNKIEKEKSSLINWLIQSVDEHIADNICHITSTERTDWNDAYNNKHTHSNKTVLDNTTASFTTEEKNKLSGIATGAEVNVQSDWNNTNTKSDEYIKNKPTSMPASDVFPWAKAETKPAYTKSEVGLSKVENKSSATIRGELTKQNVIDALGYTPGSADTLVDTIEPNTITANKLMIGDFTNYATVNENFPNSMLPTSTFGGTSISDGYIVKPTATNPYLMLCDYTPCNFKSGEQIYYEMLIKGTVSGDVGVSIYYYDSSKKNIVYRRVTHSISTEEQTISGTLTISDKGETAIYFLICVEQPNLPRSQIYVRKAKFIRKSSGNLIVDGAITANKLATNAVTTDKLAANAVTAEKMNVNSLSEISSSLGTVTNATFNDNVVINGDNGLNALVVKSSKTAYVGSFVENAFNKFGIYASESKNTGLFNYTKTHWLIREDEDGNVHIPSMLTLGDTLNIRAGSSTGIRWNNQINIINVSDSNSSVSSTSIANTKKISLSSANGNYHTHIYGGGGIYLQAGVGNIYGNKAYSVASDQRVKVDGSEILSNTKYIDFFDHLIPRVYHMENETEHAGCAYHSGFYAQEVEDALIKSGLSLEDFAGINLIHNYMYGEENGFDEADYYETFYTISYDEFIPIITAKIKSLESWYNHEIKHLNQKIELLENKITELEKR